MGKLNLKYKKIPADNDGEYHETLSIVNFQKFNSSMLKLGNIAIEGKYQEGLAVVFDLAGFTEFCDQIGSHLIIPDFLNKFLNWLFQTIAQEFVNETIEDKVLLWCRLPFYSKFMGDGVLFIWNTDGMAPADICNLIVSLEIVSNKYKSNFLTSIPLHYENVPEKLRCGISRGTITSIGKGEDFVGACINLASRLQKLESLSFAFSNKGIQIDEFHADEQNSYLLVKAPVRGIRFNEYIYILKHEYEKLPDENKAFFKLV